MNRSKPCLRRPIAPAMTRRHLLQGAGALLATGIAGCTGDLAARAPLDGGARPSPRGDGGAREHDAASAHEPTDARVIADGGGSRGPTALSELAASMSPGTVAELETIMPAGLWTSPPPSRGLHIAGWTDDAHWDSASGQFLYMGLRQTRQFIAYSEVTNEWRVIPLDPASDNPVFQQATGHIYGTNAFDHERSRFYHHYRSYEELDGGISFFDVATERWTKLPGNEHGGMCLEYFGAMDGLLVLERGHRLWFFHDERRVWEDLGETPVHGYHSMFRHNPFREEVLMAGGNETPNVVARLTRDGVVERLADSPARLTIGSDRVMVDPVSGRYLILASDEDMPKRLFEFDSDLNEYRLVEGFTYPFGTYAMPVMAFVPEYGVTMWAEKKVFLYKHAPVL
jgi:hypothetical protein